MVGETNEERDGIFVRDCGSGGQPELSREELKRVIRMGEAV